MSSQELKTFRWRCDECKIEVIATAVYQGDSRPSDWKYRKVYDCGMTGYTMLACTTIQRCQSGRWGGLGTIQQ